ncbi:MAG: hypothetical protein R6T91_01660 [Bacteroidales bacterium]
MNKLIFFIVILFSGLLLLYSCTEDPDYPDTPRIKFERFQKINNDSTGIITLSFTDGDGDIGLASSDTLSPYDSNYFYNFFLYIFERKNGQYDTVQTNIPFHGRIPLLENVQEGESIEGEIDMEIDIFSMDVFIPSDTVRFEIFIVDRALNHSNTVTTPRIVLNSF